MYDLLFKNAKIVDGTNAPWYRADLAVKDGKIAKIGKINDEAKEVIDCEGLVLSPGFIDIHSHSDFTIYNIPLSESRILQGVTTELGGDCGLSPAPVNPERVDLLKRYVGFLDMGLPYNWTRMSEYLDLIEQNGTSTNYAQMIGQGTIRIAAMGFENREPTEEEMAYMKQLVREAMEDGAYGMSTGLIYPPGCFSFVDEISEVAKPLAEFGGFYESHMRNESDNIIDSVLETMEVGKRAGIPVQIVHHKITGRKNWKIKGHATLAMVRKAREEGFDITMDQYPYVASATTLTSFLPKWAKEGGMDVMLDRLRDKETIAKIKEEVLATRAKSLARWSDIMIASVFSEKNAWTMGLNVEEMAEKLGMDPFDAAIWLILEEKGDVNQVTFGMCEEDVEMIMKEDFVMTGSDGSGMMLDAVGVPHPRNFGTFPRVIGHYCRERKLFSLEKAIHKMTGMPSARIGLNDRGVIKEGMWADLVLFDFDTIIDTPSYTNPKQPCEGIKRVYVNGVLTAKDGVHTGAKAGKVLRKGR